MPAVERRPRADALLEQFGLRERAKEKPDLFSGGQAQRVMIARALMHQPQVLFLDEPSTGLDPAARLFLRDRLRELKQRGVTLVLTTHDMHEAAELADRVAIIDHGKLLVVDTPQALVHALPGGATVELTAKQLEREVRDDVVSVLRALPGVEAVERVDAHSAHAADTTQEESGRRRFRLYVNGRAPMHVIPAARALDERGLTLTDIRLGEPSLEDVFIHLTGRALR